MTESILDEYVRLMRHQAAEPTHPNNVAARAIREQLLAALASPPTAAVERQGDERAQFDAWADGEGLLPLAQHGSKYTPARRSGAWLGWLARASLSSPAPQGEAPTFAMGASFPGVENVGGRIAAEPKPAGEARGWHAPGLGEVHNADHSQTIYCEKIDPNGDGIDMIVDDDLAQRVATALAHPTAQQAAEPVAWIRDQRGEFEGPQTLDPLFVLALPGLAQHGATYTPLYTHPAAPGNAEREREAHLCIAPVCGEACDSCNSAISPERASLYAKRYAFLRGRPLDSIRHGGVFAGKTPDNLVLNGKDLDTAVDAEMGLRSPADGGEADRG